MRSLGFLFSVVDYHVIFKHNFGLKLLEKSNTTWKPPDRQASYSTRSFTMLKSLASDLQKRISPKLLLDIPSKLWKHKRKDSGIRGSETKFSGRHSFYGNSSRQCTRTCKVKLVNRSHTTAAKLPLSRSSHLASSPLSASHHYPQTRFDKNVERYLRTVLPALNLACPQLPQIDDIPARWADRRVVHNVVLQSGEAVC